jgi:hypothetical protein
LGKQNQPPTYILHRTLEILKWNRKTDKGLLDAGVYDRMVAAQDNVRATLNLTPTADNPWEKHIFKDWKHRITNICLQAVQSTKCPGGWKVRSKGLLHLIVHELRM